MGRYNVRYKREHYVKRDIRKDIYERLIRWCGESSINVCLEKALSILTMNAVSSTDTVNVESNPTKISTSSTKTDSSKHYKHHIYCLSPQEVKKIRNFEAYKVWVDKNFTLHRWWREEDGRVCFETSKPVKIGRGVRTEATAVGDVVEEVG